MRTLLVTLALWLGGSLAAGQTLVMAIGADPSALDPQVTAEEVAFFVTQQVYETLVQVAPDGQVVPGLALAWSYPNAATLRMDLRQGVTFHDGSVLDAAAVVASLERLLDLDPAAPGGRLLGPVREIRAVDADTIDIVSETPFAPLLTQLAHPSTAIVSVDRAETLGRVPVGTGPFAFERWAEGSEIVLHAYADHWGGAPGLERVVFRVIADADAQVFELRSGGVDLVFDVPAGAFARLAADPAIVAGAVDGWGAVHLVLNLAHPPLGDVRVRQAIAHAIDRQQIAYDVLGGLARPAASPVPRPVRFAVDLPEAHPFDPARAVALLAEAGHEDLRLRLDLVRDATLESVAQALRTSLAEVGIELDVRVLVPPAFARLAASADAEALLVRVDVPTLDADDALYALFHSSAIPESNWARYADAAVDGLLEQGREVPDDAVRTLVYGDVQAMVVRDLPLVTLVQPRYTYAKRPKVQGEVMGSAWFLLDLRAATLAD